ncbi:MAG TPA: helix-turn-helix domain-containing protein [Candidatus Limnocylindria bacterium]|nr:helix-turn-helix domain-containing protein [Candidatus Limnocylindria bacterium]
MARLGETLRTQREKKGITLEQAAHDTRIREKFLKALEDSDYQTLPGAVYTKGFLRNYAEYLELDTEDLVVQFHQERDLPDVPRTFKPMNPIMRRSLIFTPAVLVPVVVLAGIVLFVSYLYYQFVSFAVPPKIEITEPSSDAIAQSADYIVKGKTVPDGRVTLQVFPGPLTVADIHPNADGTFTVAVQLNPGSNHIEVEVLDVTGKVGRASRTVRLETVASSPGQPVIIIEEPANGATYTNIPVLVRGGFDPSVTVLTVNGVQLPISAARRFEIRFTYPAGPQTITVVAQNGAGATSTETRTVTVAYTAAVVNVTVKGGDAYLQATVDGTVVPGTGRVFKDGETATYTGRQVRLRSGNGAATMVSYNGQPAVAMGQPGEVVERVYTAQ